MFRLDFEIQFLRQFPGIQEGKVHSLPVPEVKQIILIL